MISPEILYFLASDEDPVVRKAVATNLATPAQADFILSNGQDGCCLGFQRATASHKRVVVTARFQELHAEVHKIILAKNQPAGVQLEAG